MIIISAIEQSLAGIKNLFYPKCSGPSQIGPRIIWVSANSLMAVSNSLSKTTEAHIGSCSVAAREKTKN